MTVSIVIRTKNEEVFLPQTLESIYSQEFRDFDVIVVDSGSSDGTLNIVRGFKSIKLVQIRSEEFTYGRALNIGTAEAAGNVVVFLSAHAIPANDRWLSSLVGHFTDASVAGVYGKQLPHGNAYPPVRAQLLGRFKSTSQAQTSPDQHFFSNANAAIRRDVWERTPFNEEICYCEDQMWARTVLSLGHKIMYEPEAAVYHSHNESIRKVYQRSRLEELGFLAIYPERQWSLTTFCNIWWRKVLRDVKFIMANNEERKWLLIVPVYRFFEVYGFLEPHLPGVLWRPIYKRIVSFPQRLISRRKRRVIS